ncbi:hypothetical protein KZZ07_06830 [Mameliella sp. CS4]|uniref:hypothetical protein n=1 Tax=Mameliella sp. CS4 TaxID=2862329 RepID=UPI001C5CEB1F|nr:hypothetical protein [Mameliella sp. CS4]MBW4982256.1 hypothetical protein [Mameliella sp. CS4]
MELTRRAALGMSALALAGCAAPPGARAPVERVSGPAFAEVPDAPAAKIRVLERALLALGPGVAPAEAAAVARISVREPLVWAERWDAVDPPLIHNIQVNTGRKPRGLCKDWADDLEARLKREGLESLSLHRAIANADNLRIEHSTVIVSTRGAPMQRGLVLDPWRLGQGRLWFGPVASDPKYRWVPRAEVFAMKRARRARRAGR